jgi:hypothetical protein
MARAEERFTAHRGERRLDARMGHIERHHHVLGIGAADDRQFGLGHRREAWASGRCRRGQRFEVTQAMNAPVASAPMAMRPKSGTSNGGRTILPP